MTWKAMRANLLLLLTAMVWGAAFVAQRVGMERVGPFTFNGTRMVLAGLVLLPVIRLLDRRGVCKPPQSPEARRTLLLGGALCGLCLFGGSTLQQWGLKYTTAGKGGFITALYVVLVPLITLLTGKRIRALVWVSVLLAAAGLYLLCMAEALTLNPGDLLVMGCSVCFALHILVVDRFSPRVDGVRLSMIQFFVCSALSLTGALCSEHIELSSLRDCLIPILYAGILSGGMGYTLQIVAQKDTDPTLASMIMCLESVFSALAGALLLGERMTGRELIGCALMFIAILLCQLPARAKQPGRSA